MSNEYGTSPAKKVLQDASDFNFLIYYSLVRDGFATETNPLLNMRRFMTIMEKSDA